MQWTIRLSKVGICLLYGVYTCVACAHMINMINSRQQGTRQTQYESHFQNQRPCVLLGGHANFGVTAEREAAACLHVEPEISCAHLQMQHCWTIVTVNYLSYISVRWGYDWHAHVDKAVAAFCEQHSAHLSFCSMCALGPPPPHNDPSSSTDFGKWNAKKEL